jgi:hypothetical protein
MNFKEQMQEKAMERYPPRMVRRPYSDEYYDGNEKYRMGFISASQSALTSDLFKGLVEALESAIDIVQEFNEQNLKSGSGVVYVNSLIGYNTALTNYKQEVNKL